MLQTGDCGDDVEQKDLCFGDNVLGKLVKCLKRMLVKESLEVLISPSEAFIPTWTRDYCGKLYQVQQFQATFTGDT